MRRRLAVVGLIAATAVAALPGVAGSGHLEPFRTVFKEPADTLKGLVTPKGRQLSQEQPAASASAPAPEVEPAPAPVLAAAEPVAPEDVPTPRLRPGETAVVAVAPAMVSSIDQPEDPDDDPWSIFTEGPDAPPLDMAQHEDAIEALIAGRSLGAVHKAANPPPDMLTSEAEAIAAGQPLGYATPGDTLDIRPKMRPNLAVASASASGGLDEERSVAVSGILRPGGNCSRTLSSLGVVAVSADPIRAGSCGIAAPVEVASLGGGAVKLSAKAVVNCDVASTFAAFMRDAVEPLARQKLGAGVSEVRVAATYACRSRNNVKGAKLSEHAKGNAIDISAFKVKGEWIVVGGKNGLAQNAFLKEVRKAACGPFTTVLGPGSDAYHSDHFHFDIAQRGKTGRGLYCR